ncbi:MAG: ATP-binding protein [Ruminococcus sp.]|nr:ATP-binding protein [Ruminococcus sp.]
MFKKIFRSSLLTAMIVLLASIFLIMGILHGIFENQLEDQLQKETAFVATAIENEGISYFDNLSKDGDRVTLIDKDGTVLADSQVDVSKLENHGDREEVKQAETEGRGQSVRYSSTMTEKTVYYAQKLDNGQILRISADQFTIVTILLGISQPIAIVVIAAIVLSLILSTNVAKHIVEPINDLDLDDPMENTVYDELSPLLRKIAHQNSTIEEQLKEARQKQEEFRIITDNMSEGFIVIDNQMKILTYNAAALKLFGAEQKTPENILALSRSKPFRDAIYKSLDGEHSQAEMTTDERVYSIISNPVYDTEQEVIGAVIVVIDITEISRREQLRREFTSNVSHELKTPLTSISGFAEIMKSGGTDEATVVDFSRSIYDEAQRLVSLVSDIIKLSELDDGTIEYEPETVDLYTLSLEIASRLSPQAQEKKIHFTVNGEKAEITGVRKILDEIIFNLCDNAVKYNRSGGDVKVSVKNSADTVTVTVSDTGIGIPTVQQNRVFERFYRVDKARSKSIGGTGLGLSIVKHGVMYHNAQISLESKENEGTTVVINFPKQS